VSLSDDVRGELAAIEPRKACCRLAELSALVRSAGSIRLRGSGRIAVHLEVASPAVARRAFSLLRRYRVPCEIRVYRRRAFEQETRFQLHLGERSAESGGDGGVGGNMGPRAVQALNEAGIVGRRLEPLARPPARVIARSCCRASYLRGAFLAAGSVSGPRSAHFELRAPDVEGARFLAGLATEEGIPLQVAERRGHAIAYAKAADGIADLLAFLGAQNAALRFGEDAVVASTRARANRLANADHANIGRASRAAEAQLRAIERLRAQGRLELVSPPLRELAELRTRHPSLSLAELAKRCRPPATKAAAHRRLSKLRRLAGV
jgi:DNA-binding protein WhiA